MREDAIVTDMEVDAGDRGKSGLGEDEELPPESEGVDSIGALLLALELQFETAS